MNATFSRSRPQIAAAVAAILMAACSSVPNHPPAGAAALRARLTQLQADPKLAGRAPLAVEQANMAVTAAEQPQADPVINAHLQFMADRKISIAAADAQSQWAVDQRKQITEERAAMQLKSRTQEVDVANQKTANAVGKGLIFQNGDPSIGVGTPPQPDDGMPGVLDDHPPGASCRVRATVRLIFPGGREQLVDVKAIAAGQNTSGTKYYGEALDFATKMAIRQYGNQFRKAVGLPTDY